MRIAKFAVALAVATPLVLSGCSGEAADSAAPSSTPATASAKPSTEASSKPSSEPEPSVSIEPSIAAAINVGAGNAVVPGSIDSVEQTLSAECDAAVKPVRAIMGEYKSGFLVPAEDRNDLVTSLNKARELCSTNDAQEWADFYTMEFAGWFYAKTD